MPAETLENETSSTPATPEVTPEASPVATPEPVNEPEPSAEPTPAPDSQPADTPEPSATPEPATTPVPTPDPEPAPDPSPVVSPMPSPQPGSGLGPFNPPGSGSGTGTEPEGCAFEAQYVRTDGYHAGMQYPRITVIRSRAELDAYYEANKNLYNLERRDGSIAGFLNACDKYDEVYFESQDLILVLLEEGSGSVRHEVTGVRQDPVSGNWTITIKRRIPEIGTSDMAEWHIFVEIQAGKVVEEGQTIQIQNTF